jgi:hypothetical protein
MTKPKSNMTSFKRQKLHGLDSEVLIRKMIFGQAPILENEDSAEYELLLERHYADFKPKDIAMECYVHDGAYWNCELRRLRRMGVLRGDLGSHNLPIPPFCDGQHNLQTCLQLV